jgi:K+-sensing histidine kinase KdpD
VNTLLDFSRIEAGRIEATYEPVDLSGFTAELASVFRAAIDKAGLRYAVDCEDIGEPVYVDREMWEKIVLNLISNAFKLPIDCAARVSRRCSLPSQDTVKKRTDRVHCRRDSSRISSSR